MKVGDLVKLSDFGKMRTAHIWEHKIKIPKCGIIPKVESTDSEDAKHSKNPDSEIDPDQAAKDVLRDLGYI